MGWYYNPPQPTQALHDLVQASSGQPPPIKALAATAAAIVSLWPVSYDHSLYLENLRLEQTAPLTLSYGQQPPRSSRASFYAQRAQWPDPTWSAPQSPPDAAIVARVDNPPLIAASPVIIQDPARPIYGVAWQYGTQTAKGDFSGYSAPIVQAPPVNGGASLPGAMSSWAPATWNSQDLTGFVVQPSSGDEPPGVSWSVPDLGAFGYYDGWPAQNLAFDATTIPPPVVSAHLGPNPFPYTVILSWQSAPTWSAQTEPDVQPLAAIVYGSQPPPTSIVKQAAVRSSWADATWNEQSEGFSASIASPPIVNSPPPSGRANLLALLQLNWPQPNWPPQSVPRYTAGGPAATPVLAGINAIAPVLSWPTTNWAAQTGAEAAAWIPQPVAQPYVPLPYAVLASWTPDAWASQSSLRSAATLPVPRVDSPPPGSFAMRLALRAVWPIDSWPTQTVRLVNPQQPFKRGELIPLWPDDRRITITVDDRRIYPAPLT